MDSSCGVSQPMFQLNTQYFMPLIGLGTFKIRGYELIYQTLDTALKLGYRSFDTASVYRNEADIGKSLSILLPKYGLKRSDVFLTSKLGPAEQGECRCHKACLQSLEKLQCDYLDLYLTHWPGSQGKKPEEPVNREMRLGSWKEMMKLHKEGKLKSIGVSNFLRHHIDDLISSSDVIPAVLQIEHHPHLVQSELVFYCKEKGIHFQAYSSLGTTVSENQLLSDSTVNEVAKKYNKSPAQILLKWAVQQNIGVLPKSTNPEHIRDNIDLFDFTLSEEDIQLLTRLDKCHHYCWNPEKVT